MEPASRKTHEEPNMKRSSLWLATMTACVIAAPSAAEPVSSTDPDYPRGRISGYVFGDVYYYNVSGDPGHSYSASGADTAHTNLDGSYYADGNAKVIGRDLNGVQVRRIYFQLDNDLSIKYSTRFRLEADGRSLTSDGKIGVAVKAAYLVDKNIIPRGNLLFGILATPIWENSEEFWAYRSVEKTIADFRGIGSAADIGIQLKGFADVGHKIGYSAMLGDGAGQMPENNRYKKYYLTLSLRPIDALRIEPHVDYEDGAGNADRATYKLFSGYEFRRGVLGVEIVDRVNHKAVGPSQEQFGFSIFGRWKPIDRIQGIARFDRWQPNTRAADRVDSDLWIAGFDWEPYKDVHLIPNIEYTQFHEHGAVAAPQNHDLQARLTFFYKFAKP